MGGGVTDFLPLRMVYLSLEEVVERFVNVVLRVAALATVLVDYLAFDAMVTHQVAIMMGSGVCFDYGLMVLDDIVLIDVLNCANVMVHVMILRMRVDNLRSSHIVMEVVEWLTLLMMLFYHMIAVLMVMLSNWRRRVVDLGMMMHVGGRVMRRGLRLTVRVLVVHDRLLV